MDWVAFIEANQIDYVTRGPNTKRGEISIKCPFCGDEDPSQHLGISLVSENWGCHRDPSHRGHSQHRLVAALLGCSYNQAKLIVAQYGRADPENLEQALAALTGMTVLPTPEPEKPRLLPEFKPIEPKGTTAKFWRYLCARGFEPADTLCDKYSLMCCLTGRWKDRIIIPVLHDGELVAWTGRALVNPINAPRYLSSSEAIKSTVFNGDVRGGRLLLVTEGPFDAMKLDFYGGAWGVQAVACFGVSMSVEQIRLLRKLRERFDNCIILFDSDAIGASWGASDWIGAGIQFLPEGVKDPGSMSQKQVRVFLQKLLN
jgi:Toprim-like